MNPVGELVWFRAMYPAWNTVHDRVVQAVDAEVRRTTARQMHQTTWALRMMFRVL